MDPNEALSNIRRLVAAMHNAPNDDAVVDLGDELRDAVEALDGWLSRGGFPPEVWREGPDAVGTETGPDAVTEEPDLPPFYGNPIDTPVGHRWAGHSNG